jgi:hypothetical protein
MSNEKHTPGPWPLNLRTVTDSAGCVTTHAEIGPGWSEGRYMSVSGCIDEADARLIAAAPELLEALQDLLEDHVRTLGYVYDQDDDPEESALVRFARAAIAKATGSAA